MRHPPLQLDLVAASRRPRWIGYLVLAASLALGAELWLRHHDTQAALGRLDAVQGLVQGARPARVLPRGRLEDELKAAQAAMRQLALPWAQLVESLEAAAMPGVAVLQVEPEAQQRLLRVTAEARGEKAMLAYVRRLSASSMLSEVHLIHHQVNQDDPRRPLLFTLQASFR